MSPAEVRVALIWAMSSNRVIGRDNQLPWHMPNDLRHFKRTTLGQPIIMGRRTYESTGGALPGRTNIVVTSGDLGGASQLPDNVRVVSSMERALALGREQAARDGRERCFVCGGSAVYAAALDHADELFVTEISVELAGDAYFPEFDLSEWVCIERSDHEPDDRHAYAYSFVHYRRVSQPSRDSGIA